MRLALLFLIAGCGKQANPDYIAAQLDAAATDAAPVDALGSSGSVAALAMLDMRLHDRNGSELQACICECDAFAPDESHF